MGRPGANIDWKIVEDLLVAGCSGAEIAGYFGLNNNTIYERCMKDHGISFTEYSSYFYSKGDALIRAQQYKKALGDSACGDNTLLIWLGKNRLKQRENHEHVNVSPETLEQFKSIMKQLNEAQSALNKPENNTNTDEKSL